MQSKIRKPKVCFISLYAYALLTEKNLGFTGGAELQQVLLAKELSRNAYDVSFVTYDFGQKGIVESNNKKFTFSLSNFKRTNLNPYKIIQTPSRVDKQDIKYGIEYHHTPGNSEFFRSARREKDKIYDNNLKSIWYTKQ